MGKAIGGYVRRCERKVPAAPIVHLRERAWWRGEIMWQTMPMLRFEQFDVDETLDVPGIPTLRLPHGTRTF